MMALIQLAVLIHFAHAATVVFPAPDATDYEAYVTAHREVMTPSQMVRTQGPDSTVRESLLASYAQAQATFIGAEPEQSVAAFKKILDSSRSGEWGESERRIFFHAALRLAQMSKPEDVPKWLRTSIAVAPDLKPEADIFPPPLVEAWKKTLSETPQQPVRDIVPKGWSGLRIQGIYYDLQANLSIPNTGEPMRLTWISDRFQPVTKIANLDQARDGRLAQIAWIKGHCEKPEFSDAAGGVTHRAAFFGLGCKLREDAALDLNVRPNSPNAGALRIFDEPKSKPIYKSPWFWAGVGAVVVIVVAASQKHGQKKDDEPTTTYGY